MGTYRLGIAISLALLCLASPHAAFGDRDLKEDFLSIPLLVSVVSGTDTSSASGFLFGLDGQEFLVTARHVLFDCMRTATSDCNWILKGTEANLRVYSGNPDSGRAATINIDLRTALKRRAALPHSDKDVAIIHIGDRLADSANVIEFALGVSLRAVQPFRIITLPPSATKKFSEVMVGNSAFVFGYPTSIGLKNVPQVEPLKPLLRRGAIAGKNMQEQTLILDCPVYYGNSGGPVIEVEQLPNGVRYRVVGVVSEFVPFAERWVNVTHRYSNMEITNSGYSVAVPMDFVLELIHTYSAR